MVSCSSNKMNQPQSPKRKKNRKKKLIFGPTPYAKMGSAKKNCKIFFAHFCPFWMLPQNFCLSLIQTPNAKIRLPRKFRAFLLRTALKDRPKGPPTANHQPPPTEKKKEVLYTVFPKRPRVAHMFNHGWWWLAVGGWWFVVGGWWLVAVGSGWRLAVGGRWRLAAVGGSLRTPLTKRDWPRKRTLIAPSF